MPSLRKRRLKSGATYWDVRYRINGVMKVKRIGETDRRTAELIYHEFCAALATGELFESRAISSLLLEDLAAATLKFAQSNKNQKTSDREQLALRTIIGVVGNIPIRELTPLVLEDYKAVRLAQVSPHTLNIELRVLNTALNQAKKLGIIDRDCASRFTLVRTTSPEPPSWLNNTQVQRLMTHSDPQFRRFMQVALHTGCRRNEILGLRWSDIDLPRRQLVVRGVIGKMGRRRTVPIGDALTEVFVKWPDDRHGLLFPNYKPDSVSQKFRRWARQIGLPSGIHLHSLRATFACHLIDKGVDIYTVSRLLGHSSVKVTERHYLALDQRHIQEAVNCLNFTEEL